MSDSAIDAVSGLTETQSLNEQQLMLQLEGNSAKEDNSVNQIDATYASTLQSLAQSTGDDALGQGVSSF